MELRNYKEFITWFAIGAILVLATIFFTNRVFGSNNWNNECEEYDNCDVTPTPIPTIEPCHEEDGQLQGDCITPTPTEPEATPSVTPEATPTDVPPVVNNGGGGSDGLGCANHDCNTHKNDKPPVVTLPPCTASTCGWK